MSKKRKSMHKAYVPHPRYGDKPMCSGEVHSANEILASYWQYRGETIFPESAIAANSSRQNYSIYPRSIYVDIERNCRDCGRPFIFFAREQQYWFEELGFYIDADCVKCVDCRKAEQQIKGLMLEYEKLQKIPQRSPDETQRLEVVVQELIRFGYIKRSSKAGALAASSK